MPDKIYEHDDWALGKVKVKIKENGDVWLYVGQRDISWQADGTWFGSGYTLKEPRPVEEEK